MNLDSTVGNNNGIQNIGNILERTVCLSLELRKLGIRKKVAAAQVNKTDADDDALHVSKEILQSRKLEEINSLDGEIRKYVSSRTVPSPFRSGVYLLSLDVFTSVDARLERYAAERQELVDQFMVEYEFQAQEARTRLGSLYDPRDYPSHDRVRRAFGMKTSYLEMATPGKIRMLSPEIYNREVDKARAEIANATEEIRSMLRAAMADLVDHLVDRLAPKPDGTAKIFRDTLISNVKDFLETFQARNIVDDQELAAVVEQARAVIGMDGHALSQVDAQMLRDDDGLRDYVRRNFVDMKSTLDGMMINRPKRKIDFSE